MLCVLIRSAPVFAFSWRNKVNIYQGTFLIYNYAPYNNYRLLLPLITWQIVGSLEPASRNNSKSLSMYGFLYGTFPTAPSVFLYASHFSVAQDVVRFCSLFLAHLSYAQDEL